MGSSELIDAFRFCPRCGREGLRPMADKKSLKCVPCGYQHFINSVLAAGVFITDEQGRLLLIRRLKEPSKGKLGLPGGFSDPYESAETVARREVLEEINIELGPLRYLTSYPNRYEFQGLIYSTVDIFFAASPISLTPLKALDDVAEIVFIRPRDVDPQELAFESLRHGLQCLIEDSGA
ncbi:MAG TPA: NUDIX domain-containing protein [Planctomycetota bacterium]|jgi:ADP-ribose pyrophosphatase YjhB (NUDIX family)